VWITVLLYVDNQINDNQNSQTSFYAITVHGLLSLERNFEGLQVICYHSVHVQNAGTSIFFYRNIWLSVKVSIYIYAIVYLSCHCHNLASLLYPHISSEKCHLLNIKSSCTNRLKTSNNYTYNATYHAKDVRLARYVFACFRTVIRKRGLFVWLALSDCSLSWRLGLFSVW
jgi:hypothetical protein